MRNSAKAVLKIKKLSEKARLPTKGSALAAGYDLYSAIDISVPAKGKVLIPTNLSVAVPEGNYGRVAPRSGLAWKNFIDTGAGVVDADYRGECKVDINIVFVLLFNFNDVEFHVKEGDRVAQLIIEKITDTDVVEVEDLDDTNRGSGGFGSTGVSLSN
jgi:dUTP pyrophosphatase